MNVKEQLEQSSQVFKSVFGEKMLYNGIEITAINDQEETNKKEEFERGTSDKSYFSVAVDDVPNPQTNDEIIYLEQKYRVIRIKGRNGGFIQVETNTNSSVHPRGR